MPVPLSARYQPGFLVQHGQQCTDKGQPNILGKAHTRHRWQRHFLCMSPYRQSTPLSPPIVQASADSSMPEAVPKPETTSKASVAPRVRFSLDYFLSPYYEATPVGKKPYPNSLQDLLRDNRFPDVRRYLRRNFTDPLTGREEWGIIPAPGGGIAGVFSLSEAKPIKIGQFDQEFKTFA